MNWTKTNLMSVINFVSSDGRITVWRDPNTRKIIRVYFVVNELTQTIFMHIDASSLTVMNFAVNHGGVGTSFHFKSSDTIIVYVICLEVTL